MASAMTEQRPYAIELLRLAAPVALARLGIIGMGIADIIVVGQLAPRELPDQALGWAPTGVFLVCAIGLLTGVQVLAARVIGERKPEEAGVVLRRGLMLALAAGGVSAAALWFGSAHVFTLFGISPILAEPAARVMQVLALSVPLHLAYIAATFFVEAIKKPGVSTIVMWLANAVNLAGNLMFVPHYGAVGSAWSTVASRLFLAGALLAWIWLSPEAKTYGVRGKITHHGPGFAALLGVGIASAVSQLVEAGAFSAMTFIAGRIGASAVAAYQIMLNIMALIFMIALGLATASAVLVSDAIGRKAPQDAARAGWTGIGLNAIAMIAAAGILLMFAAQIGRAYTADGELAVFIASLMWMAAIVLSPDGAQVVIASSLRARGDNWFPTFSHILAYAVAMPLLGFWWAERQHLGVKGLLLAIIAASVLSAGVLAARWAALARVKSVPA
jgi:MATE family multidrug resistance protein